MEKKEILGVGIRGVIVNREGNDAIPNALDALRQLSRRFSRIVLVSAAERRIHEKTRKWLAHHDFYAHTGIKTQDVIFCHEWTEKGRICRRLGVTHFVDDRLDVLGYMKAVSHLYLFQPNPREVRGFSHFLPRVTQVNSWQEVLDELLL